jgi:hypothetical protein
MMIILTTFAVIATIIGLIAVLFRPHWAFVVVIAFFALEQLARTFFPVFSVHGAFLNYAMVALAMLAVFLRITRREPIFSGLNNPVTYLVFAQYGLWLLGMLYSPVPESAAYSLLSWPYIVLYLCILPLLIIDLEEFHKSLMGLMVVGIICALMIFLNPRASYYGGRLVLETGTTAVRKDIYGNPLAVAELAGIVALIAALLVPHTKRGMFGVMRVVGFILCLGLAVGSGSRGQVLAAVVAGVLFFPVARRLANVRGFILTSLGLMVLVVAIYATFSIFIGEQNRGRWSMDLLSSHFEGRYEMALRFVDAWSSSPSSWFFGMGTNAWSSISGVSGQGDYVHNIAVELLCEQGLVGASIFVLTIVLTIVGGKRMWSMYKDNPAMRSAVALFFALSAYSLFNALKQGSITSVDPFYWWLLLSKVARHEQLALRSQEAVEYADSQEFEPVEYPEYALAR